MLMVVMNSKMKGKRPRGRGVTHTTYTTVDNIYLSKWKICPADN